MHTVKNSLSPKGYQQYSYEMRQQINTALSNFVSDISKLRLLPQIQYALLSGGKRLRPIMLILSAQCVGGDKNKVMPLAIAFELIHTASLIHDDIVDKEELRRGTPTLYRKWSIDDAILTGDAMIALAIDLAADFGAETMRVISRSALELCDGEYMDIHSSLSTTIEEDYFLRIKKKSASLFRDAAYCGALIGGGSRFEVECLSTYGENFGVAYQIRDDLFDLSDLKRMHSTLPMIHLHETSDSKRREQLEKDLQLLVGSDRHSSQVAFRRIQRMLNEAHSIAYCKAKAIEYVQKSIASLAPLKNTAFKSHLIQMAQSLIL